MSVIIAIKNKNGVFVGADKQATVWKNKIKGSTKIYKSKIDNNVIGCVGYCRDGNLLLLQDSWIDEIDVITNTNIDFRYVVGKVVPRLFELLKKHKRVHMENGIEGLLSTFMFCTKDRIFTIYHDGSVIEHDTFATIGCGQDLVYGYLNTINIEGLTEQKIEETIKTAIKVSCKDDVYIGEEIDFMKV